MKKTPEKLHDRVVNPVDMVSPGVVCNQLFLENVPVYEDSSFQRMEVQMGDLAIVENNVMDEEQVFKDNLLKKVDIFVDGIRSEIEQSVNVKRSSKVTVPGLEEANKRGKNAIIHAEKFRASVANPPGRFNIPVLNGGQVSGIFTANDQNWGAILRTMKLIRANQDNRLILF